MTNPLYQQPITIQITIQKMDKASREGEQAKLAKKIKNFIYHPSDQVGSGFSSQVFKGINQLEPDPAKKNIAIKVIELSKIQNEVQNYLLNNQVNALKLLRHPNVLQTVDILMTKNNVYIVTEFCEGGDLLKFIKANGPFSEVRALAILKDIVEGYKCIEENNIIHRDLKTSNIFLSKGRAKIADFGFCQFLGQKKPQIAYNVGSPAYMSPESYKQNQYSHKSDIWAIGIILYQLLVGQTPERTSTYTEMANNLMNGRIKNIGNQEIRRILCLCFKRNVKERIDAIGLAQLVGMELGRLQALGGDPGYSSTESGQTNKGGNVSSRAMSPNKSNSSKDIKFFKADIPKPPNQPPQGSNTSLNRLPQPQPLPDPSQLPARKSLSRQPPKPNQLKPHTEYLLFLYRLIKFLSQLKYEKCASLLLPLFRHRSQLESLAEQHYQQTGQEQQEFFKEFQYLKNRFDEVYLQQVKDTAGTQNIYKDRLDSLANVPFGQPECLVLYRKIAKDTCGDLFGVLDRQAQQGQGQGQQANVNRNQIGAVIDYVMIWYQLLGLHLEGVSLAEIVGMAKIESIVKEQPKKIYPGHIELLKIKYNTYLNPSAAQQIPTSSNQKIQPQVISKDSNSNQRQNIPQHYQTQNQQILTKLMSNFGPIQPQPPQPQPQQLFNQPGMVSLAQIKNGFQQETPGGLFAPNMQHNPIINQIPIHQSVMMHK